jgi:hypothetical protein
MVLPATGSSISYAQIQTEMGGANPISVSEYYQNSASGYCSGVTGIPSIGSAISASHFLGKSANTSALMTTSGQVGYYTGESWNGTRWTDLSGANNHVVTKTGTIGTTTYPGTSLRYMYGDVNAALTFPSAILPPTYTLFYIAKYNGTNQTRIVTSANPYVNWLSGFWEGKTGVAWHGGFITQSTTNVHSGWFQATDMNRIFRSAKVNRTIGTPSGSYAAPLGINNGFAGSEYSDWAVACVIVYNRTLTATEYVNIENELAVTYKL